MTSIAAAVAVFYALGSLALSLFFWSRLRIPADQLSTSVTLVLPATGSLPGLEDLLAALCGQSLSPRRLIVAVESPEDPAFGRVAGLIERYPQLKIELVVAGLSPLRSQKCTNLLAALGRLDTEDTHVVFFDADIRPQSWWLAALIAPLAAGRADIVDGYRWPVPKTLSAGAVLAASIDRAIAVLPRLNQARLLWGGSLAVSRRALEILDLPRTIARAVTEDLSIAERAAQTGLRVLTRRAVRVPTPLDGGFRDLWRFGRRQYQLIRLYRPGLWAYAAFVVTTDLATRLVLLGSIFGGTGNRMAAAALLIAAGCGSLAAEIRRTIGRRLRAPDRKGVRLAQHLLAWTLLPAPAFHFSVVWGSMSSTIEWAHIRYMVDRSGHVVDLARFPHRRLRCDAELSATTSPDPVDGIG